MKKNLDETPDTESESPPSMDQLVAAVLDRKRWAEALREQHAEEIEQGKKLKGPVLDPDCY